MCLIIHKPTADLKIPSHILDNAEDINPDGFGIVYLDDNSCVRTMDYDLARQLVESERPFIAHYRYATRGVIDKNNCHPYVIETTPEWGCTRLFSNGTVADLGDKNTCDTKVVAEMLKKVPYELWGDFLSMTETRFAITYKDGVERHGTWHELDGVYYSKNNCFHRYQNKYGYGYTHKTKQPLLQASTWEDEDDDWSTGSEWNAYNTTTAEAIFDWKDIDLVAVYGTLKAGHSNHHIISASNYVGAGKTATDYPMQDQGIPFVFDFAGVGGKINVEVYDVKSDKIKDAVDSLEGHPTNYERKLTNIKMLDGSVKSCWLYFGNPHYHDTTMKYVCNY